MPSRNDTITICTIPSPIGNLCISASEKGLQNVKFTKDVASFAVPKALKTIVCQLNEYFADR